jgi:hypothetical protein
VESIGARHRDYAWNSCREPHLGSGHVRPPQQTGHMAAIASIRTHSISCKQGAVHIWIPGSRVARPGMTTRERVAAQWHDGQDCASHRPQISGLRAAVPFRQEGRFAIVTNAGRDVVDARASARGGVAGRVEPRERYCKARRTNDVSSVRQNRVVLTPVAGAKSAVIIPTRPG